MTTYQVVPNRSPYKLQYSPQALLTSPLPEHLNEGLEFLGYQAFGVGRGFLAICDLIRGTRATAA
jgi:hypothetical protein